MTFRSALTISLALAGSVAMAHPSLVPVFNGKYNPAPGSALAKSPCAVCHVGMSPKLNPYGADLQKAMKAAKAKTVTPAILAKVEKLDSDKDGAKNIVEIKAGTLPGDPKSKPAKSAKPAAPKRK
jgi:hypothetical protein